VATTYPRASCAGSIDSRQPSTPFWSATAARPRPLSATLGPPSGGLFYARGNPDRHALRAPLGPAGPVRYRIPAPLRPEPFPLAVVERSPLAGRIGVPAVAGARPLALAPLNTPHALAPVDRDPWRSARRPSASIRGARPGDAWAGELAGARPGDAWTAALQLRRVDRGPRPVNSGSVKCWRRRRRLSAIRWP
jgi:hypothetical protein